MAQFDIISDEGTRFVKVTMQDETVRAESGALCYHFGKIVMDAKIPGPINIARSLISQEAVVRPYYKGTGTLYLESSFGGFHVIEVANRSWILESGAYWASEGSVELRLHREPMITSFWAGEGLIDYQTKVSGTGKVVIASQGPIEEVNLNNEKVVVEGKYIVAREAGLSYKVRRATKSIFGRFLAKESFTRVYQGTGRVLICSYPYWRVRMAAKLGAM